MLMLILVPDTWARGRRKRWQWAGSSRRKGRHGGNKGHAERTRRSAVPWPIWFWWPRQNIGALHQTPKKSWSIVDRAIRPWGKGFEWCTRPKPGRHLISHLAIERHCATGIKVFPLFQITSRLTFLTSNLITNLILKNYANIVKFKLFSNNLYYW